MKRTANGVLQSSLLLLWLSCPVVADEYRLHTFERQELTGTYFSEGANAGDVNGDGVADVVYGPYWFAGPDYKTKHEIYRPVPQDTNRYADNFFSWVYDFNGDGWNDVFGVGFPGTPAYVYENPKTEKAFMSAVDYIRVKQADGTFVEELPARVGTNTPVED